MGGRSSDTVPVSHGRDSFLPVRVFPSPRHRPSGFPCRLTHVVCGFLEQEKPKAKPGIFFWVFFGLFCTSELGFWSFERSLVSGWGPKLLDAEVGGCFMGHAARLKPPS